MRLLQLVEKKSTTSQAAESDEINEEQLEKIKLWHEEICASQIAATQSTHPALQWGLLFSNFLNKYFKSRVSSSVNNNTPLPFALCIGGSLLSGISTPYSPTEIFIILKDKQEFAVYNQYLIDMLEDFKQIAKQDKSDLLGINFCKTKPPFLCGNREVLLQQLDKLEGNAWLINILSASVIMGDNNLLHEIQHDLTKQGIYRYEKHYKHISSFLYDLTTRQNPEPKTKDTINLQEDIMAPLSCFIFALKYEFNLLNISTTKELIFALETFENISPDVATLIRTVLAKASKIMWDHHLDLKKPIYFLKITSKNREELLSLLDIIAVIRTIANQRIKRRESSIYPSHIAMRCVTLDKQNLTLSEKIISEKNHKVNIFNATDEMKKYFDDHINTFKIDTAGRPEAIASRLFNDVSIPAHFTSYIDNFFLCVSKGNIEPTKFHSWLWAAIRRCSHDIFDTAGHIKQDLLAIINQDKWYDNSSKKIGREKLNNFILFSYFMNALFAGIVNDPRYIKINQASIEFDSLNPLMRQIQLHTNDFFQSNIYSQKIIKKIQETNYYAALIGEMACLNSLIARLANSLKLNINNRESELYRLYLGTEDNINSLQGLFTSINTFIKNRERTNIISPQEFHDYDTKINKLIETFAKELLILLKEIKTSWRHRLFIESCEIDKILPFIDKMKIQLAFFAQEAVKVPENKFPEKCSIS